MSSTEIFDAVRHNRQDAFRSLLASADLNGVNEFGQNLLHVAIASKNTDAGLELIRRGVKVDQVDSQGQTPLHYAGIHQNEELARAILNAGADPSIKDVHGNGPLWSAVVKPKRNYEIVRLILQYGPDPRSKNKAGMSPLDFAKQIKSERLIALLEGSPDQTPQVK